MDAATPYDELKTPKPYKHLLMFCVLRDVAGAPLAFRPHGRSILATAINQVMERAT